MPSSTLPNLTNLATPQPTMLLYAALSPFGATDDRKITANTLLATITQNISDVSVQFDDGLALSTVSAAGKGKLRYNDTTKTFQFSADGAAYANLGGGSSKWNGITDPDGNLALTMAAFTSTFTYNAATGANSLYVLTTGTDDTGTNYVFSILTPGGSNAKKPIGVTARGSVVFEILANGSPNFPGASADSQRIGKNAVATGQGEPVAVGTSANANQFSTVVGGFSTDGNFGEAAILGWTSTATQVRATVVGQNSTAGQESIAIGKSASAPGTSGGGSGRAIAIGSFSSAGFQNSLAIGRSATTTAANQVVIGGGDFPADDYQDFYFGRGVTHATPVAITFNVTGESGTDQAGVAFQIAGGKATGNAAGGPVAFLTSVVGASGTTLQSLAERARFDNLGNFGLGVTAFGTSAVKVIGVGIGTAPSTSPADMFQVWGADSAAGDANAFARNEAGEINRLTGLAARVSTQFDKTTDTALANITGLTRNVEASRVYAFTAVLQTTSNVAGGVKFAIAGTATATSIAYEAVVFQGGLAVATGTQRATALGTTVGDITAVTTAYAVITGTIVVNAAGTLTVQFAQNASNGAASSVLVNSSFQLISIS